MAVSGGKWRERLRVEPGPGRAERLLERLLGGGGLVPPLGGDREEGGPQEEGGKEEQK